MPNEEHSNAMKSKAILGSQSIHWTQEIDPIIPPWHSTIVWDQLIALISFIPNYLIILLLFLTHVHTLQAYLSVILKLHAYYT